MTFASIDIQNTIDTVLYPKIDSIITTLLQVEPFSLDSAALQQIYIKIKYYRIVLDSLNEIVEGNEEITSDDLNMLLQLCGASPASINSAIPTNNTNDVVQDVKEDIINFYVDNYSQIYTFQTIIAGVHGFKFVFTGSCAKMEVVAGTFKISSDSNIVELPAFSTGNNGSIDFIIKVFNSEDELLSFRKVILQII